MKFQMITRHSSRGRVRSVHSSERGNALLISLVAITVLLGLTGAILATSAASRRESRNAVERTQALYAAEAGVSDALAKLAANVPCATLGAKGAPLTFADGGYWVTVVDNKDTTYTVTSAGKSHGAERAIQAVITGSTGGVFQNAIFAGNSSGDPAYALKFGGKKTQADTITGDIYSGNNITFVDDATDNGVVRASGAVTAASKNIIADKGLTPAKPQEGVKQPIPDIAGMSYETTADIDVAKSFKTATYGSAPAGGSAYQLPASDPAHIFRLNPSDRKSNWSTTTKDDYFLEDPYNPMHTDPSSNGKDAFMVSLTNPGQAGSTENPKAKPGSAASMKGGVDGNKKVYYIDGNLWIHNLSTMSFKLEYPQGTGLQVTFVVKGNVYFSDNIYTGNSSKDGIAFIAMKDPNVKDSGNIYFGDPNFGTLEHMDAFMYAENNFYDTNLSATGSATVTLNGNMTAGNQVAINRDSGTQHSKLTVNYDNRVATGALVMPGLPKQSGGQAAWTVSAWREVAVP